MKAVKVQAFLVLLFLSCFYSSASAETTNFVSGSSQVSPAIPEAKQHPTRFDLLFPEKPTFFWNYPSKIRLATQTSTEKRSSFYIDYLLSLFYSKDKTLLVFFNPKETQHRPHGEEMNMGLGVRKAFPKQNFILGFHTFYDKKYTVNELWHYQIGFGFEYLSEPLDFRFNFYDPLTRAKTVESLTSYEFGPSGLLVSRTKEEPLKGFDLECGLPLPFTKRFFSTRIYPGAFYYNSKLSKDVSGFRFRTETELTRYASLDLTLNSRNSQETEFVAGLRFTIPLDINRLWDKTPKTERPIKITSKDYLQERLFERVVRDLDVQSSKATQKEPYIDSSTGKPLELIFVDNSKNSTLPDGTYTNPYATITQAFNSSRYGEGKYIYVFKGNASYYGNYTLANRVTLWGSAYNGGFKGLPTSGYPLIDGEGVGDIITLANNNQVMGLQIQNPGNSSKGCIYFGNINYANIHHNIFAGLTGQNRRGIRGSVTSGTTTIDAHHNTFEKDTNYNQPATGVGRIEVRNSASLVARIYENVIQTGEGVGILSYNSARTNVTIWDNAMVVPTGGTGSSGVTIRLSGSSIQNVTIYNNSLASRNDVFTYGTGISLSILSTGTINANIYKNNCYNNTYGVQVNNAAGNLNVDLGDGSLGSTGNNAIYNNTVYAVDSNVTIKAENNWWGSANPPASLFNGTVDYEPWLLANPN